MSVGRLESSDINNHRAHVLKAADKLNAPDDAIRSI